MEFVQGTYTSTHYLISPLPTNQITDYLTLLPRFLPPSLATPLLAFFTSAFGFTRALQTFLTPLLIKITTQPDMASVLTLVVLGFIGLQIVGMAYRMVMWWVRMVLRIVLWGATLGVGLWVWNRGVEGFLADVHALGTYWLGQYERFKGEAEGWKSAEEREIWAKAGQQNARARQQNVRTGGGGWGF
jgi:hypothetical protein